MDPVFPSEKGYAGPAAVENNVLSNKEDNKETKTRIPVSRTKQSVERVQKDIETKGKSSKSYIPKLASKAKVYKAPANNALVIENKAEKDFEKLYEEINENNGNSESLNNEILNGISPLDPEQVDDRFEEIIHAYVERDKVEHKKKSELEINGTRLENEVHETYKTETSQSIKDNNPQNNITDDKTLITESNNNTNYNVIEISTQKVEPIAPLFMSSVTEIIEDSKNENSITEIADNDNEVSTQNMTDISILTIEPIAPLCMSSVTEIVDDSQNVNTITEIAVIDNEVSTQNITEISTLTIEPIAPLFMSSVLEIVDDSQNINTITEIEENNNEVSTQNITEISTLTIEPIAPLFMSSVTEIVDDSQNVNTITEIAVIDNEVSTQNITEISTLTIEPIAPLFMSSVPEIVDDLQNINTITEIEENNNEVSTQNITEISTLTIEPIAPLSMSSVTKIVDESQNVNSITEIPVNENEVSIQNITETSTLTIEPIAPLSMSSVTEIVDDSQNVNSITEIAVNDNEVSTQNITETSTLTIEPIAPLSMSSVTKIVDESQNVNSITEIPVNENEVSIQNITETSTLTIESIAPLSMSSVTEIVDDSQNVNSITEIAVNDNEVSTQNITETSTLTIEPIAPLSMSSVTEIVDDSQNVNSNKEIAVNDNKVVTYHVTEVSTLTIEPIAPLLISTVTEIVGDSENEHLITGKEVPEIYIDPMMPFSTSTITEIINEPHSHVEINENMIQDVTKIKDDTPKVKELNGQVQSKEVNENVDNKVKKSVSQKIAMFEQPPKEARKRTKIPMLFSKGLGKNVKTYETSEEIENIPMQPMKPAPEPKGGEQTQTSEEPKGIKPVVVDELQKIQSILKSMDKLNTMANEDATKVKQQKEDSITQIEEHIENIKPLIVQENKEQYVRESVEDATAQIVEPNEESVTTVQSDDDTAKENNTFLILHKTEQQYAKNSQHIEEITHNTEQKSEIIVVVENSEVKTESDINLDENNEVKPVFKYLDRRNKIRRFKSVPTLDIAPTPQRKKSLAEIDLGDAIKGRVGTLIQRMNSIENLKGNNKEVINKNEMPKKQTVLDRIALFEKKSKPTRVEPRKMEKAEAKDINIQNAQSISNQELKEQITDLKNAKIKYPILRHSMPTMELNNGERMPILTLGTALLEPALIYYVISAAIDLGYRAFDTAFIYGNEKLIGEAIKAKIADGTVTREDLFITSKLWNTFHKPELVEGACRNSLQELGLDYFDLYLIHNPISFKEGGSVLPKIANVLQYSTYSYLDAWRSMENLIKKGLVRSIGVSNFNSEQIARISEKGSIKPVVNQVESHPYLNQSRLDDFCSMRDIKLSCYATLGSKDTPLLYKTAELPVVEDPLVKMLAAAAGRTPAQMLIRYQLDQDRNVVVKTSKACHLWDNLQALNFRLSSEEISAINALNKNKRYFTFKGMGDTHRNYPFNAPF